MGRVEGWGQVVDGAARRLAAGRRRWRAGEGAEEDGHGDEASQGGRRSRATCRSMTSPFVVVLSTSPSLLYSRASDCLCSTAASTS